MSQSRPETPKGVIAYLTVADGKAAIAFYKQAFGATEIYSQMADDGKRYMHAQLRINDGLLMLSDDFPEYNGGKPGTPDPNTPRGIALHIEVDNCDATVGSAAQAGATVTMPPADMFWGDRYARLKDPFGHVWSVASPLRK
jgi:PhnB protein